MIEINDVGMVMTIDKTYIMNTDTMNNIAPTNCGPKNDLLSVPIVQEM